jgi:hypothetical protein
MMSRILGCRLCGGHRKIDVDFASVRWRTVPAVPRVTLPAHAVMAHDRPRCNLVHMAARHRLFEDPPSVRFVKKAIVVFVAFHVPLALWSPEILVRFQPGLAHLRATARGRPQWLREPLPEVRELPVELLHPPRR